MRVLAVNDISCVGKCSLTVALPVLSACGVTCDILPTALLSTHTGGFTGYTFLSLDEEMKKIADHWQTLGLQYDLIYSGYLGSRAQIAFVKDIRRRFLKKDGIFVVDPVLGDNFTFYKGFDDAFATEMLSLCAEADYILPNETESYLLTGTRDFSAALGIARVSFASAGEMQNLLGLTPGSLSVVGLINDREGRVQLCIDREIEAEPFFLFHPGINTASVAISVEDLFQKLLPALGHEATAVDLPDRSEQQQDT